MTIELVPLSLPDSADASSMSDFGREVRGVDPCNREQFAEIRDALYKVFSAISFHIPMSLTFPVWNPTLPGRYSDSRTTIWVDQGSLPRCATWYTVH